MSRIRTIKPEFFFDEDLAELSPLARLLFIGLWTQADREGRLEDRPKRLKAALLPYDDCDVNSLLGDLAKAGFIIRYEAEGAKYIQVPGFTKHQRPHVREAESTIPPPPKDTPANGAFHLGEDAALPRLGLGTAPAVSTNEEEKNQEVGGGDDEALPRQCSGIAKGRGKGREGKGTIHTSNSTEAESDLVQLRLVSGEVAGREKFGPQELVDLWNEKAHPIMPRVRDLTAKRRRQAVARLREHPDREWWEAVIAAANASPHCRGESKPAPGANKPWRCNFDFLIDNDTNAVKVLEGVYGDDRATHQAANGLPTGYRGFSEWD